MKNIIYQTLEGAQTDMEFQYWDNVLLANMTKAYHFDNARKEIIKDDAVVFYSSNKVKVDPDLLTYFAKLKNYSLVHMSNEGQNHLTGYYKNAISVIRSTGWSPNKVRKNVFFVPVGFMSGYYNDTKDYPRLEERKLIWSFAGAIKADRAAMLDAFKDLEPNFHFSSQGWGDGSSATQKTTTELREIYKNTIFAPSPLGNSNFECFRTMEVLEYGCIPIVPLFLGSDPYKYLFGDHPLIMVKNWEDARRIVDYYLGDRAALQTKMKEVQDWYVSYKEKLSRDIPKILNGDFANLEGEQWKYQQQSHHDLALRWRYFKHFALKVYWKRLIGKAIPSKD